MIEDRLEMNNKGQRQPRPPAPGGSAANGLPPEENAGIASGAGSTSIPSGLEEYLDDFLAEFSAALTSMETSISILEKDPANGKELETLYRNAHNMKGGANALGLLRLGDFFMTMESVLAPSRKRMEPFTSDIALGTRLALAALVGAPEIIKNSKTDVAVDLGAAYETLRWILKSKTAPAD